MIVLPNAGLLQYSACPSPRKRPAACAPAPLFVLDGRDILDHVVSPLDRGVDVQQLLNRLSYKLLFLIGAAVPAEPGW